MKKLLLFLLSLLLVASLCIASVSAATYQSSASDYNGGYESADPYESNGGDAVVLTTEEALTRVAVAFGIALVVSLIVVLLMKRALNTVRKQKSADGYAEEGSFSLTESRDIFLYSTVTRIRVNTSNKKR